MPCSFQKSHALTSFLERSPRKMQSVTEKLDIGLHGAETDFKKRKEKKEEKRKRNRILRQTHKKISRQR